MDDQRAPMPRMDDLQLTDLGPAMHPSINK